MSWIEKINTELVIITGDEKRYTPIWKNAVRDREYNTSLFDYPDVAGTFVDRRQPRGARYSVEFYFQGEDNLDQAKEFLKSADDPRHWHIIHPLYGDLRVQPNGLRFDNSEMNVTKITGTVIETILGAFPKGANVPEDLIIEKKDFTDLLFANSFGNRNTELTSSDIAIMNQTVDVIAAATLAILTDDDESTTFLQLLGKAKSDIINAAANPLQAMISIQAMISFPFQLSRSVALRITTLVTQFDTTVNAITSQDPAQVLRSVKVFFESVLGTIMTTLCGAGATPEDDSDYGNRNDVTSVVETILDKFNTYVDTLDSLQSETAEDIDSYVPDADSLFNTNEIVNFSLSNLFEIALEARQERTIILEKDSNIILQTHRFYSLDQDDNNLSEFIRNNNIGLNEHLELKKGRDITYFV